MSEEPPPPQLRLRPRKREGEQAPAGEAPPLSPPPEAETPPAAPNLPELPPVAPGPSLSDDAPPKSPVAPAPPATEVPTRFRLKPKLNSGPGTTETATSDASSAVPPSELPPIPPPATGEESSGIPRLRLRMIEPASAEPGVSPEVSLPAPPLPSAMPPPIGAVPPPFVPLPPLPPPPPQPEMSALPPLVGGGLPLSTPGLRPLPTAASLPPFLPPPPPSRAPAPAPRKKKRIGLIVGGIVGMAVLGGAAAYFTMEDEAPVESAATKPRVPTPQVDPASKGSSAPDRKTTQFAPLPPPPQPFAVPPSDQSAEAKPMNPVPSPAFRAWTDDARVAGVVSGASPRAIINGRLVRPGDIVDASVGVIFDGVDAERKLIVFRNNDGAFTTKSY